MATHATRTTPPRPRRWADLAGVVLLEHLDQHRLAQGERWFARCGTWAIIFGRDVSGLRIPITIAAGMVNVRYPVFAVGVAVSTAVWAPPFMIVGGALGDEIQTAFALRHVLLAAAVVVLALVVVATTWRPLGSGRSQTEEKS